MARFSEPVDKKSWTEEEILPSPYDGFIYRLGPQSIWEMKGTIYRKNSQVDEVPFFVVIATGFRGDKWVTRETCIAASLFHSRMLQEMQFMGTIEGTHS